MKEMSALLPRFEQLDKAINSGPQRWDHEEAAEAQELLLAVDALLQRSVQHASLPQLAEGLLRLQATVTDENTRFVSVDLLHLIFKYCIYFAFNFLSRTLCGKSFSSFI